MTSTNLKERFGLLQTSFNDSALATLSQLSKDERIFAYYLYRASLAGYSMALVQLCRCPKHVIAIGDIVNTYQGDPENPKFKALKEWWIFLYSNYGVYFNNEHEQNKKTPKKLGLDIGPEDFPYLRWNKMDKDYFFDDEYLPTRTVDGDIEASGGAFYGTGVTNEMYNKLSVEEKNCLLASWGKEKDSDDLYKVAYNTSNCFQLKQVVHWLEKALSVAERNPEYFDRHSVKCLDLLIKSFITGDENDFKESQRHWTQMKNRVEFSIGFIEHYDDPMQRIGTFQADVTIRVGNLDALLNLLPTFEERFPFPRKQKRQDMSKIPNAGVYYKIMGTGGLGPIKSTIAYCLPNYEDLRSEYGSKQVMYVSPKPSEPERYKKVYLDKTTLHILNRVSPDLAVTETVSNLLTTLHETIGHASGALVAITQAEKNERLGQWSNALEELRAEIIALYTGLCFYDEIVESGALDKWSETVSTNEMKHLLLYDMLSSGWMRWGQLPIDSTRVTGAHAIADTAILYYILDHCPDFCIKIEEIEVSGTEGTTEGIANEESTKCNTKGIANEENEESTETLKVIRLSGQYDESVFKVVEEMAQKVQHIASTADPKEVEEFMKTYGTSTRNSEYSTVVRGMSDYYNRGVKATVELFPEWDVDFRNTQEVIPKRPHSAFDALKKMWNLSVD